MRVKEMTIGLSGIAKGLLQRVVFGSLLSAALMAPTVQAAPLSSATQTKRAIYQYARLGDMRSLKRLVNSGVSLETVDDNGNTALCSSVIFKDVSAYNTLILAGASTTAPCMDNVPETTKTRFCAAPGLEDRTICSSAAVSETGMSTSAIVLNTFGVAALGTAAAVAIGGGGGGGGSSDKCDGVDCGAHGSCSAGVCVCEAGYSGTHCEVNACDSIDCGSHGSCSAGACVCDPGYTGTYCDEADSCYGVDCGAHGTCSGGACICDYGYIGEHCEAVDPATACDDVDCGAHGSCVAGVCHCEDGYSGGDCSIAPDPCWNVNCGEHGTCVGGTCNCWDDYTGDNCEIAPGTPVTDAGSIDRDTEDALCMLAGGKIINGVCTIRITAGTEEEPVTVVDGSLGSPIQLAEFGGEITNEAADTVSVAGDSSKVMVGMWANGVSPEAPVDSKIDLSYASKALNEGTINAEELTSADSGVVAMKATSAGTIRNNGNINVTALSAGQSAAMDVSRIADDFANVGTTVKNYGTINLYAAEKANRVNGIWAPDRKVLNGITGHINITLGKTTADSLGEIWGMRGTLAVNRGSLTLQADDLTNPTTWASVYMLASSGGGTAVNDGTIDLNLDNVRYSVYGIYPYPSDTAMGTAKNAGTINVTGHLYNNTDEISKQVYLIGAGSGNATLLNEGVINVGQVNELDPTDTSGYFDVSDGGIFYVMNGQSGTATNNQKINLYIKATDMINDLDMSALTMQSGTADNNGTIYADFVGSLNTISTFRAMSNYGSGTVTKSNKGTINLNNAIDGLSLTDGLDFNLPTGVVRMFSKADYSSLMALGTNTGKVVLIHDKGSGATIDGYSGANAGSVYIRANDYDNYGVIMGGGGLLLTPGGDSDGLVDIKLTGTTGGIVWGATQSGYSGNLINIDVTDPRREADLGLVGNYASAVRSGDMNINVRGVADYDTSVTGFREDGGNITHNGVLNIKADMTALKDTPSSTTTDTSYRIIGMQTVDTSPHKNTLSGKNLSQYKAINSSTAVINITVDAPAYTGNSTRVFDGENASDDYDPSDVIPFDVIGMATNSYAENNGTINLNVTGGARTAGMVAYQGGVIHNNGTIRFNGDADKFVALYGVGTRDIVLATKKDPDTGATIITKWGRVYATVYNHGTIEINGTTEDATIGGVVTIGDVIQLTGYYGSDPVASSDTWARYVYNLNEDTGEYDLSPGTKATPPGESTYPYYTWNDTINPTPTDPDLDNTIHLNAGVNYVAELNGVFSAPGKHILGDVIAGKTVVLDGNKNTYLNVGQGQGALIGDGDFTDLGLTSGSALFSAAYRVNPDNPNGLDIVMTRKAFGDVIDNASLAGYLEKNYTLGNNESFFNSLKGFEDAASLNAGLNRLTGRDMLARFNFEDMTMMRELNFDMNEKLFHNKEHAFTTAGYLKPMAFRGDTGSDSRYSLFNRRKGKMSVGLGIAFTNIRSDNTHDDADRKETMYQLVVPIGYRTHGFNLMTSPRLGYARGTYDRTGFENRTYDGHLEKRMFGLMNEARYPLSFGDWTLEPSAEFNVLGYTQRGHEDAKDYALNIRTQRTWSVESGIGLYLTKAQELSKDTRLKLSAGVAVYHEFADPYKLEVGMRGMDGSFTLRDENRSDNRGVLRAGFDYEKGDYSLYGSVISYIDNEIRTSLKSGMKWKF